ncbi:hypothetical protein acsn021_17380 [Anaerocolumna cellulosilytica]|uniref:Uncharacterized protein n=1 Tax=Anaerocolumna cellulosilytica TaxID=433286 RepID=A0A6S6QYM2_9FIRM|nr:radical SAM protein [Anaerocolumna cellulosilytica]MBB5194868.1 p-methyltransferase [Anaerocolumna cellulosilytica]BCJ94169.1 hypothetical protein acsn021_17380 [Anaerocolumna cellulosilytica]
MIIDCVLIGFNDEKTEATLKKTEAYKNKDAAHNHEISRSAIVDGHIMKYSDLVRESISRATRMKSDLSIYRMPNIDVHDLHHYLKKRNIHAAIVNDFTLDKKKLTYLLRNSSPKLVGISSTCVVEAEPIREMVDFIRNINPTIPIVVRGPFINNINYEYQNYKKIALLQRMGADIYIHERQGEKTLHNIYLELCKEKPDLSRVPNILYKSNIQLYNSEHKILRTIKVPENIHLDDEPVKELTFYGNHIKPPVYIRTDVSCVHNCTYCPYPISGDDVMYSSLDSIEKNLNYIHSLGVKYIIFRDVSLNKSLERFKSILRMMIRNKYDFNWFSYFIISHSDDETYDLMEHSGCKGVILDIDSGVDTILKNMDKQVTRKKLAWGIKKLKEHNIISYASCTIGFPGETVETAKETIQFIEDYRPTFYDLQCWFYDNTSPIAKEKIYYNLEGSGYTWSHKDMDSSLASDIVFHGIKKITNSYFMPSTSFNLWSLVYYLSQGAELEEFFEFSKIYKQVIGYEKADLDKKYIDNINEIMGVFKNNIKLYENLMMRNKQ